VLVTSPLPGDGKTFVSAAISRTFANSPHFTVQLLDFDLIRRTMSALFGAWEHGGVIECVTGRSRLEDVVAATDKPRLNFIPAGVGEDDRREAYIGDSIGRMLNQLRQLGPGHICFLDAPPVMPVIETALIASQVDLVLLVVRAGVTPQGLVRESLAKLGDESKVCIVLNSVSHGEFDGYYDYDYTPRSQQASS
jgi:Mrp family chromosome partitioning ATPase